MCDGGVVQFAMTMDAADPVALARFWMVALDYVEAAPPAGWSTWEAWLRDQGVPEDEWGDGATIADPRGVGPPITFLKVPEPKRAKNRLHLDLRASGGRHVDADARRARIQAVVAVLTGKGATVLAEHHQGDDLDHVVLADPEGNELCVV
jgi:Glyoxalase-like domain